MPWICGYRGKGTQGAVYQCCVVKKLPGESRQPWVQSLAVVVVALTIVFVVTLAIVLFCGAQRFLV